MPRVGLTATAVLAGALPAAGAGPTLEHQAVSCLVAGQYPRLVACVSAPDDVARAQVFFRQQGSPAWYHVIMEREAGCFAGVLPKPRRQLVGRQVEYYLEAADRRFESSRTAQHAALVVRRSWECRDPLVAAIATAGPKAVFPAVPSGFAAGGIGTGTLVAVAGAGAAAGGALVVAGGGSSDPSPPPPAPAPGGPPATTAPPASTTTTTTTPGAGPPPTSAPSTTTTTTVPPSTPSSTTTTTTTTTTTLPGSRRVTLTVAKAGNGGGTVSSTPAGIDCGATCTAQFDAGSAVRLVAAAAAGSTFRGWSGGGCSGTGACSPGLDAPTTVTASFERTPAATQTLTVEKIGTGGGRVTSTPAGIDCGSDCSQEFPAGSTVDLAAGAAAGSTFVGWSGGGCGGAGGCRVTLSAAQTVTAKFDLVPQRQFTLTVERAGRGAGVVAGDGIACPSDCAQDYPEGSSVAVEARVGVDTVFSGWELDCFGQSAICQLTMSAARRARARFDVLFQLNVSVTGPGHVTGDGGIQCPGVCSVRRVDGAVVTLRALAAAGASFVGWTGDCTGSAEACQVTLDSHRFAAATFRSSVAAEPPPNAAEPAASLAWASRLEPPGASGIVRAGGQAAAAGLGTAIVVLPVSPGENRVDAELITAPEGPGLWRFAALTRGVIDPGSIRVLAGEVVQVEPEGVVFRLAGKAGERVAFAFRATPRP